MGFFSTAFFITRLPPNLIMKFMNCHEEGRGHKGPFFENDSWVSKRADIWYTSTLSIV